VHPVFVEPSPAPQEIASPLDAPVPGTPRRPIPAFWVGVIVAAFFGASFLGLNLLQPVLSVTIYMAQRMGVLLLLLSFVLFLVFVLGVTAAVVSVVRPMSRSHPIRQPLRGRWSVVSRCPNCGATSVKVDGSGGMGCAQCGTQFIVP